MTAGVPRPEPLCAAHFERLREGFECAAGRLPLGLEESHYLFGGRLARMRIVGKELARQITRAFDHLRLAEPAAPSPALDICLWEENETGIVAPRAQAPAGAADWTEISVTGRFVQRWTPRSVASLDRKTGHIVGAVAWDEDLDVYERGKPLARLLAEWYADQGVGVMHAGLVSRGQRAVLLAGRPGSGKSTLALGCVRAGLDFLGEDYAALEFLQEGVVMGHSAYSSVFLEPAAARWFPELAPHVTESRSSRESKSVILLADVWPSRLRRCARIEALAICRVTDAAASTVRTARRAEALLAVAPSSLLSIHGRRRDSLDRLATLIERVPCVWLDLGRDLASAPACIDELLGRAISV